MLRQIVKVEVYVQEVIQVERVNSDKEGTSSDVYLMRHASKNTQTGMNKWSCYLARGYEQGAGDYPGLFIRNRPPAIKIEVFSRNESDSTRFSKFHCKRLPPNGEAVGHPWLLFVAWKNIIFCYYFKVFSFGHPRAQQSIPVLSADITLVPPFWSGRYLAREEVLMRVVIPWFVGFNGAVHWSLCWRGLGVTLSGLAFVTSLISTITPWFTPSKISTHNWVGPRKVVSNRAPLLLTPALIRSYEKRKALRRNSARIWQC